MHTPVRSHRQLTASGSFPVSDCTAIVSCPVGAHCLWLTSSRSTVIMKLTKKQLSVSHVTQATASGPRSIGDVANHGNSRLDRCPMASPQGKVELPAHVSFGKTSRERVRSPYHGLEKRSQLRERHPSCKVEEGPQSVKFRDTCYVDDKAREQWRRSDGGHLR